jgi:hypothetical protein
MNPKKFASALPTGTRIGLKRLAIQSLRWLLAVGLCVLWWRVFDWGAFHFWTVQWKPHDLRAWLFLAAAVLGLIVTPFLFRRLRPRYQVI